jgi:hypothetical protein
MLLIGDFGLLSTEPKVFVQLGAVVEVVGDGRVDLLQRRRREARLNLIRGDSSVEFFKDYIDGHARIFDPNVFRVLKLERVFQWHDATLPSESEKHLYYYVAATAITKQ